MVKYSCLVVVTLVSVLYLTAEAQKLSEILEKCKTAEKATDTDYTNLKTNVKPKTKAMKCLGTCISEKLGWINNNKMNAEGLISFVKTLPTNSDKVQQSIKEIIEECKSVQDADRCEFGSKLMDCVYEGATKRGIKSASLYPQ